VIEQGQASRHQQNPSTMTHKTSHSSSLGILAHLVRLGVYNHLRKAPKSKVFRFHYHSQKVIGSLGHPSPVYIPFFTSPRPWIIAACIGKGDFLGASWSEDPSANRSLMIQAAVLCGLLCCLASKNGGTPLEN